MLLPPLPRAALLPFGALCLQLFAALPATAQSAGAPGRAPRGEPERGAPPVDLRVQPPVGDVLRLRMQQTIEMRGARSATSLAAPVVGANGARTRERAPRVGPRRDATPVRVTEMELFAHSTVESRDADGTVLAAESDSLVVRSGTLGEVLASDRVPMAEMAAPMRLRVAPNGAMTMLDRSPGTMALGTTLSAMPAMLPDVPVRVGESWQRDVVLPQLPGTTFRADGVLRAVFRLDSLTRGGREAWISVRGELAQDGSLRELPVGAQVVTAGTLTGVLLVDRVREWIVDARTTIEVVAELLASEGGGAPMELHLRITQRMRVR